ncbi:MAG: hypothetical protein M3Y70_06625 [Pseudomonadota bacterium]|nr:hypothetical protein [Pseudomonadota bacterium]
MKRNLFPALLLFCVALPACDRERAATSDDPAVVDAALPRPEPERGSVTGMPDEPGPGTIGPPPEPEPEFEMDAGGEMVPVPDLSIEAAPGEPAAADAVAVLRDYYAAIAARDHARAYALWSGRGEASGQTLEQFAAGFADTAAVAAEPGTPGRIEPAAGSRYIEVPVSVSTTGSDGSVHRYVGSYTLRCAVVDGASAEQRAWRISSADIREVR